MTTTQTGLTAAGFAAIFQKASVLTEKLENTKGERSKSTTIGNFLTPHVGKTVPIQVNGRTGHATLCVEAGRSGTKRYWFEYRWDDEEDSKSEVATELPPVTTGGITPQLPLPLAGPIGREEQPGPVHGSDAPTEHSLRESGNDETW